MRVHLKKLSEQVVVITGATSGIGLATAREAARRGARLVLVARNEEDLAEVAHEIEALGSQAHWVRADVSDPHAVEGVLDEALARFGGIDTWVNNAGVSIYGRLRDVDLVEARRLFDVNFWGTVHGSRVALRHLRDRGGAIVNVGSVVSERVIPLQGIYSASKHAVKAYTDALRMELEMDQVPVSVTLVKPAAIDTPYPEHARNHLDVMPQNAPPVYAPDIVADVICYCAEHPKRDVVVGGAAKVMTLLEKLAPRVTDKVMGATMERLQRSDRPPRGDDSLFMAPLVEKSERGVYAGKVRERSLYTALALHPGAALGMALGVGLALAGAVLARSA